MLKAYDVQDIQEIATPPARDDDFIMDYGDFGFYKI